MPVAVFCDPNGIVTHVVKTDGDNAERDLAVHTNALKPGNSIIRVEDADYAGMKGNDLLAHVLSITNKITALQPPTPAPPSNPEPADKAQARKTAFDSAIANGKRFDEAMAAGENAAKSVVADAVATK